MCSEWQVELQLDERKGEGLFTEGDKVFEEEFNSNNVLFVRP
jgi:hypothetical protein